MANRPFGTPGPLLPNRLALLLPNSIHRGSLLRLSGRHRWLLPTCDDAVAAAFSFPSSYLCTCAHRILLNLATPLFLADSRRPPSRRSTSPAMSPFPSRVQAASTISCPQLPLRGVTPLPLDHVPLDRDGAPLLRLIVVACAVGASPCRRIVQGTRRRCRSRGTPVGGSTPQETGQVELRNLVWATSKHDVYLVHCYSIVHWSSLLKRVREILNVAGRISPNIETLGSRARSVSRVRVSTMCVKDNLMLAGGFQGELICKLLNHEGVAFCSKITSDENPITNGVDIFRSPSGSVRLMTANNDCHARVFDAQSFTLLNQFLFPWSVNNTSVSPDGRLLAVLGDSTDCLLTDSQSGKVLGHLKGHLDYSFTSSWHPEGRILATGSQDKTCRLWDVRNLSKSLVVLEGRMAAIRAIKFTSDGRYMVAAEPADFVHIFDAQAGYEKAQELDFFGEIAGVSFSQDTEALFVGVVDRALGSLMEFRRRRGHHYLDSYF